MNISASKQIYQRAKQWVTTVCQTGSHCRMLVLCLLASFATLTAWADPSTKYTDKRPLIITGESDVPPYEYLSSNGTPTGHNVELLDFILNEMKIPHVFNLTEWNKATLLFERHEADLIITPSGIYDTAPYYNSRNNLTYYRFMVASRVGTKTITRTEQLKTAKGIVVRINDKTIPTLLNTEKDSLQIKEASVKDALIGVYTNKYNYFIWAEEPMKWKIRELSLTSDFTLSEINIPAKESTFAGYDQELIDQIDDLYARLEQHGQLAFIHDKWLHPERSHNNAPLIAVFITLAILGLALILFYVNRMIHRQLANVKLKAKDAESMMRQALSMGNFVVTEYDIKTKKLTNRHGRLLPAHGITREQFYTSLQEQTRDETLQTYQALINGEKDFLNFDRYCNLGTEEAPNWVYLSGMSFAERDEHGHVRYIVSVLRDMTREHEEEKQDQELAAKYIKMFDSTLTAMSFYDKNGRLLDLNQNMRTLCEFDKLGEAAFRNSNLFDSAMLKGDLDPARRENFHVCQHMLYPELGIDKYIEIRINPTYIKDRLQYYVITSRDVTAERAMYLEQHRQNEELRKTEEQINSFEQQLRYLLENSNMWVWRSSLKEKRISLSHSLQKDEYSMSFEDYLACIDEQYLPEALEHYGHMKGTSNNINAIYLFKQTPANPNPHWCASNGMPIYDADGNLEGHFGIVRDVTELMEAQMSLKRETARAEDSGKLKSVFLANMTHEIRTPLNAIVGFSDLLQMIDTTEERSEFIRIIRNNCDMLIRLINDIIEASTMNQGPLSIEPTDIDFAVAFNDICQTLAQRVQEPGVEFIVDNPYPSFRTCLDKGRMQQVITNFTTNAVKYTHQGHIKVGYRYLSFEELQQQVDDPQVKSQQSPFCGIYMYCEDTGAGIPKDKQGAVFERFVKLNDFVQGTGLGLSICKSISDRCSGRIGVMSEGEGKGSTFWIWIPCYQLQ